MTRNRRPFLTTLVLAVALATIPPAAAALAAPPPIAQGMCSLLTPAEISAAFPKGDWQVADDGETTSECYLHNGRFDQAAQSVLVKIVPSDPSSADGFFTDLRAGNADAVDVEIAGVPGVYVPFSEGASFYVRAGEDWWFTIETGDRAAKLQQKLRSLAAIVAGRLGVGTSAASPDPTVPGTPAGVQLCEVVTLEEVAHAMGEPLTATTDAPDDCVLAGDPATGATTSLTLAYRVGDALATTTLEDLARQTFPDAPEGAVLGVLTLFPAVETTDAGLTRASAQLLPDPQTWISVSAETPATVDAAAAVVTLSEAVLDHLGMATGETLVPDPGTDASPAPSGDLVSRFPTAIDGSPVTVQLDQPLVVMNLPAALQKKLQKALKAQGVSLDDARIAAGGPADGRSAIVAIQVTGADSRTLGPVLVQAIGGKKLKRLPSPAIVGTREAFLIEDSSGTIGYAHPSGDVLWMVFGETETGIALAFAALP